jgi:hypothetical protein
MASPTRLVLTLALLLAAPALVAQQGGGLRAFSSDRELAQFLRELEVRHRPVPPAPCEVTVSRVAGGAAAGGAVVRGRVRDQGGPAAAALVRIDALNVGAATGADGRYRVVVPAARIRSDSVTLTASRAGLVTGSVRLRLAAGDSVTVDFGLCAQALHLEDVVVSGLSARVAGAAESVTNVQHAGADEGGIVKVHGDHLVMLRRGRLFTVSLAGGRLTPVDAVDAYERGIDPRGTWYDELLVSGETVAVIGYSYTRGGTEIGLFRISPDGRLAHRSTYHLRSNDYYSSRNYASRLVDGKLVFYTPLALFRGRHGPHALEGDVASLLPSMRRWRRGATESDWRPIATAQRVYRPARELPPPRSLALHTVTVCAMERQELDCEAHAVLGPFGHAFYVSPRAVYVWLTGWPAGREGTRPGGMAYRIPLDGGRPGALGVHGSPVDQFSFLESDDRHLNVLVRAGGGGHWMWQAERDGGDLSLLRLPLSRFGDGSGDAREADYRHLPSPPPGAFQNRFVGDRLLYGTGAGWGRPQDGRGNGVFVVDWRRGGVSWVATGHPVDRIEALGAGALVVGADRADLHLTSLRLAGLPAVVDRYVMAGASQGETRSHGFFYRADDAQSGVLGLPVRGGGAPGHAQLRHGSASILFLRNQSLRLGELGSLAAAAERTRDDGCVASCVDWYGNARPLFLRGRIFALMGYELVEGTVENGRIREVRRVDYSPGPRRLGED